MVQQYYMVHCSPSFEITSERSWDGCGSPIFPFLNLVPDFPSLLSNNRVNFLIGRAYRATNNLPFPSLHFSMRKRKSGFNYYSAPPNNVEKILSQRKYRETKTFPNARILIAISIEVFKHSFWVSRLTRRGDLIQSAPDSSMHHTMTTRAHLRSTVTPKDLQKPRESILDYT